MFTCVARARWCAVSAEGLTLGLLVCFDIQFDASLQALTAAGLQVVVAPMEWTNPLPVSDALAVQRGVSWVYNITLLAVRRVLCPAASAPSPLASPRWVRALPAL